MRADHEAFLQRNVGPATRAFAETIFDKRLRPLIDEGTSDPETIGLVKFLCVVMFTYGIKAAGEGAGLLDG